jgi:hypothetical protein
MSKKTKFETIKIVFHVDRDDTNYCTPVCIVNKSLNINDDDTEDKFNTLLKAQGTGLEKFSDEPEYWIEVYFIV